MDTNQSKKELILAICGILLIIVVVVGVSYAVFNFSKAGAVENTISTGTISFTYNETSNGITITNAQPMTDAVGKLLAESDIANGVTQGYFDFNVGGSIEGSSTITYEVYTTMEADSTMDPNYVKIYLTDGTAAETPMAGYDGSVVPVYSSLPVSTSDANGKRLYIATFNNQQKTQNFRLRMWVADTYTTADVSKTFSIRVNVKATG